MRVHAWPTCLCFDIYRPDSSSYIPKCVTHFSCVRVSAFRCHRQPRSQVSHMHCCCHYMADVYLYFGMDWCATFCDCVNKISCHSPQREHKLDENYDRSHWSINAASHCAAKEWPYHNTNGTATIPGWIDDSTNSSHSPFPALTRTQTITRLA